MSSIMGAMWSKQRPSDTWTQTRARHRILDCILFAGCLSVLLAAAVLSSNHRLSAHSGSDHGFEIEVELGQEDGQDAVIIQLEETGHSHSYGRFFAELNFRIKAFRYRPDAGVRCEVAFHRLGQFNFQELGLSEADWQAQRSFFNPTTLSTFSLESQDNEDQRYEYSRIHKNPLSGLLEEQLEMFNQGEAPLEYCYIFASDDDSHTATASLSLDSLASPSSTAVDSSQSANNDDGSNQGENDTADDGETNTPETESVSETNQEQDSEDSSATVILAVVAGSLIFLGVVGAIIAVVVSSSQRR